jgi:hypothetical protein
MHDFVLGRLYRRFVFDQSGNHRLVWFRVFLRQFVFGFGGHFFTLGFWRAVYFQTRFGFVQTNQCGVATGHYAGYLADFGFGVAKPTIFVLVEHRAFDRDFRFDGTVFHFLSTIQQMSSNRGLWLTLKSAGFDQRFFSKIRQNKLVAKQIFMC